MIYKHYKIIKNNLYGGTLDKVLQSLDTFVKYDSYDEEDNKTLCPKTKPFLCTLNSKNPGLCFSKPENCNIQLKEPYKNEDSKPSIPQIINEKLTEEEEEKINLGIKKGYIDDYITNSCELNPDLDLKKDEESHNLITYINDNPTDIPEKFNIITINAMGIYRGKESISNLMKLRVEILVKYLEEESPDIVCLQEVSHLFLTYLNSHECIKKQYKYQHEFDLSDTKLAKRKKDIEVFMISKFQPNKITVRALRGNLGYTNSLMMIEYNNLVIINIYLQAGSKSSPGQSLKWIHYSRCRMQHLELIKSMIQNLIKKKPTIVLGDFNFDLNGSIDEWPEKKYLDNLNLLDSWNVYANKKGKDIKEGLTEDTDINSMRWNGKFEEKKYRYDGILYNKCKLKLKKTKVILKTPVKLKGKFEKYNKDYEDSILPRNGLENPKLVKTEENGKNIYDLFFSDHFGVYSEFIIKN
jgi:exonuclease III